MFGFLRRAVKREAEENWDNRNGCSSHGIVMDLTQRAALICLSTLVTLPVRAQTTETGGPTPEAIHTYIRLNSERPGVDIASLPAEAAQLVAVASLAARA